MKVKFLILVFIPFFPSSENVLAADGQIGHWLDISSTKCPFYFDIEPLLEWDKIDPPPVTIQTANAIFRYWAETKFPEGRASILNYRLSSVLPLGHEWAMWVYFIEYIGTETIGPSAFRRDSAQGLAITMGGAIVEPACAVA